jgi:hypothetical protein
LDGGGEQIAKIFIVIQAFLDESGIHDNAEVCVIAGYYGYPGAWEKLGDRWKGILRAAKVPLDKFHALDLIQHRGVFFQMPRDEHEKLKMNLARAVASFRVYPVTVALVMEDFHSLTLDQKRFFTGATIDDSVNPGRLKTGGRPSTPYFMPFSHCVRTVFDNNPTREIDFHFGFARPLLGYAKEMFDMIRTRRPTTREPIQSQAKNTPQMQVADYLCYASYKHMLERHNANDWNVLPAEPLYSLLTNLQHPENCRFFNKETIAESLRMTYDRVGKWDGQR